MMIDDSFILFRDYDPPVAIANDELDPSRLSKRSKLHCIALNQSKKKNSPVIQDEKRSLHNFYVVQLLLTKTPNNIIISSIYLFIPVLQS